MNRKEKIDFLKGLKNGTRSLSELANSGTGAIITNVLIQHGKDRYLGHNRTFTQQEVKKLSGRVVLIMNPHLERGF
jgi:hypothetical protein